MYDGNSAVLELNHEYDPLSILIVDDDLGILNMLHTLFRSMGCTVTVTTDAFDAYTILMRRRIDLLIVDMRMPQVSGLELIRKVKAVKPALRAILITAYGSPQLKKDVAAIEGARCIEKPFSHEQLKQTIREVGITV